jgi:hypothetical protein
VWRAKTPGKIVAMRKAAILVVVVVATTAADRP